ncbi:carboxypeptidase regulatory-like domain-containing protein [Candidatus Palauibacter sp.]|uniref:carboxypeptidase regulatory-like domain-containing protein n=1 Tax=Candidatus Palauibacter sp. TaxID=3101350 RepID=UPI003AF302F5
MSSDAWWTQAQAPPRWGVGTWAAAPNLIREIILARGRGGGSLACGGSPQVIIDGRLDRSGLITTLSASGIGAVEVYHGAHRVPEVVRDARADPFCTTIIIWTRQWLNEYELERLRIVLCEPEVTGRPAPLVVEGTVTDDLTEVILPRSTVTAWITDPGGARREKTTTADDTGRYRFCDLDPRGSVDVWASFAGLSGGLGPVVPADTTIVVRDLTIPVSRPGHLVGRTIGQGRGRPAVGAEIRLEGTDYAATTDEHGFFEIPEMRPGDYRLLIFHPETGSAADSIFIVSGATTDVRAELSPDPEASTSRILSSRRDPRLETIGFYARRAEGARLGHGYFFTREEIEALDAERVTDLLERVPPLREICVGRGCRIVSSQAGSCPRVPIYLDGALQVDSRGVDREEQDVDRLVTPAELAALEVYPRPVSLSDDFAPPSNRCGAIVLWSGG